MLKALKLRRSKFIIFHMKYFRGLPVAIPCFFVIYNKKTLKILIYKIFQRFLKQGMRESNSHQRFWRPLSYHLTNPLYTRKSGCWPQILLHCTLKTTYMLVDRQSNSLNQFLTCVSWSSPHPISNSQLHVLPHFHLCPIYLVVFKGVYFTKNGISHLEGGFTLRCLQRLSLPDLATRPWLWQANRSTSGPSIPVLSY